MALLPAPIERLINEFSRLPGIGPKTASRLTFYLLRMPEEQAMSLSEALRELKASIVTCQRCFNLSESNPCEICASSMRDGTLLCVVEEPLDVLAIERTGEFKGRYHVLHGAISPVEGILPHNLKISELLGRVEREPIEELILATNPNLEGEATASYIQRQLQGHTLRITRLARGLPMGGDLEYADEMTLTRALQGRGAM
ncbi:MAG: recombination protein RecR [Anaerolineales bacterium]|nr:recombination protein RecR [Anaerolineales bacterium]MCB9128824.1 recombination protein RecR [Ardenticatenales bacterium]MCB9171388.1 recombination protein RecR [Ardenticatenales bacterium]